ncbi:PspA/IM30 family protein [Paenibacillus mucilaginosus]|uniref:Phage shock protein PspA n=3 Tax=Paenibacillus mucilaginosus TaxID=61624 RepID=H6NBU2_9BACL|nr:PspA/IM30 family protein [Paenibacillus mucilaginosus]AEI42081.1 phage shock protein A, PspA [Paenibacillus mucilaginosus KNP414]AFC27893.1 phage shock protein PspA [Paenibacillus mucilaginosus 3016]AFH60046.1 phage-shock protein [Paenibacillus mucilaginosus K02]MCG7214068.1 PspA/IM30 family protein [Paenibacillus mucilaginosus]WDM28591.1 PspA/IM30 family protein [Paenibacillus mucilaginosus]
MSLGKRFRDLTVAHFNEMLEQSEDPVRLIDKYLASQSEQIRESERLLQQCLSHASSLRQQYMSAEQLKERREGQALLALKAGEEEVARMALQEKMQQEEKAAQYKALYEQSKHGIVELEAQLQQFKADFDEVASKRSYYIARLESVRLQQRMNERLRSMGGGVSPRMFDRLEERVSDMELTARTLREVRGQVRDAWNAASSAAGSAVEQELAKLRSKLQEEGWNRR